MVKRWEKFINKNIYKNIIENIIKDILDNNLNGYFIKPLKGYRNYFRIRKGNIRIIFEKSKKENKVVAIDTRGQVYRGLN